MHMAFGSRQVERKSGEQRKEANHHRQTGSHGRFRGMELSENKKRRKLARSDEERMEGQVGPVECFFASS